MGQRIDLTGKLFGRLMVLRDSGLREGSNIIWTCQCICSAGKVVQTTGKRLRIGKTRSCGCWRREKIRRIRTIDMVGHRFGRAVVVRDSGNRRGRARASGAILWECRCFGKEHFGDEKCKGSFLASRGDIVDKGVQSCGCLRTQLARARYLDIAGSQFGYLTAVRRTEGRSGHDVVWACLCTSPFHKISRECHVSGASLRSGHTTSCGCYFREQASRRALASVKWRYKKRYPFVRDDGAVVWMRAATEVAWALFLDKHGLQWQYEPRAFRLSTGLRYVPDFYLVDADEWHEIKGRETEESMAKFNEFAIDHRCRLITLRNLEHTTGTPYRDMLRRAKQMQQDYNEGEGQNRHPK